MRQARQFHVHEFRVRWKGLGHTRGKNSIDFPLISFRGFWEMDKPMGDVEWAVGEEVWSECDMMCMEFGSGPTRPG